MSETIERTSAEPSRDAASRAASSPRPESTYRLQFHAGFKFRDAANIVPYLAKLGITHLYASPYLKARPGSTHGYDVIDHCSLNPEVGSRTDYDAWIDAMHRHGLHHILDIVPNHVGVATNDNTWWNDVLENGPSSRFGQFFDIAWRSSPRPELHDKVLLPLLGSPYGEVLEQGELKLSHEGGRFWVGYYDRRFPVSPRTNPARGGETPEQAVARLNGTPGDARSFDALHELLEAQAYRLSYWRTASHEIHYRRFFDINTLAGLRVEVAEVFAATHGLLRELLAETAVDGVRVDHPYGRSE